MLRELRIKNFAIIDDLTLRFGAGLNVITGETGAGKSILLRALGLLCGERASADLVRGDTEEAVVEGVFDMPAETAAFDALGLDGDDEAIVVRRHVGSSGKGRIYVNGGGATASMLRDLGGYLVNIYGQHDQALLLRAANHLDYLDDFGGHAEARAAMERAFAALRAAQRDLQEIEERARQLAERRELLEFQRHELSGAAPVAGEEELLRAERERLRHAERIARVCGEGEDVLYAANDAMVTRLARLSAEVAALAAAIPDLASPAELAEQGRPAPGGGGACSCAPSPSQTLGRPGAARRGRRATWHCSSRLAKKYAVPSDRAAGRARAGRRRAGRACWDTRRAAGSRREELASCLHQAAMAAAALCADGAQ
jgi:DNA repair protein RecN (Recombination protein N)